MLATYHIRIMKDHAAAIIEDLQKKGAIELLPEEELLAVSRWQMEEVSKRIHKFKDHPELLMDFGSFFRD